MFARLLVLVAIAIVVALLVRRLRLSGAARSSGRVIDQKTARCSHCQVYFARAEAVVRDGRSYCSAAHAEQAQTRT